MELFCLFFVYINRACAADYEKLLFNVSKCFFHAKNTKKLKGVIFCKKHNFFKTHVVKIAVIFPISKKIGVE